MDQGRNLRPERRRTRGCGRDALHGKQIPAVADPAFPVARVRYAPVMAGYQHHMPVQPANWRELNRRVAPPGALPPDNPRPQRQERRR
jgi:hypothetical protein